MKDKYIPVIGLEVHVELSTVSKMFCGCPANWFGKDPNTQTCPVCLGLPGALPVPNKKAVEWTILLGLALHCKIAKTSKFDRKHYFYPDLPKGYQISQYDEPLCKKGKYLLQWTKERSVLSKDGPFTKTVRITRVHLEEDTGRLLHKGRDTLIDFNRSGVPLVEIVTEPDFESSDEVKQFLEELQELIRYLGISDADMEKGSMRLEPNVSVRKVPNFKSQITNKLQISNPKHRKKLRLPSYKVEVKNINSFRFAKQAIEYEIKRQSKILDSGELPVQETRGYDENKRITVSQRTKEKAHDYRYFPEPDIPPMRFSDDDIESIRKKIPELPREKVERYVNDMGVSAADAIILTRDHHRAQYFESVVTKIKDIPPDRIASLIVNKKVSTNQSVDEFVKNLKKHTAPKSTDDKAIKAAIETVIKENSKAVQDYKGGRENALMFLVGQVMQKLKGEADAVSVRDRLKKELRK